MEKFGFLAAAALAVVLVSTPAMADVQDPARVISPATTCAAPLLAQALREAPPELAPPQRFQPAVHACVIAEGTVAAPKRPIRRT